MDQEEEDKNKKNKPDVFLIIYILKIVNLNHNQT